MRWELERRYEADSVGTYGYHEGDPADPRTIRVGARHGLRVNSIARALRDDDFTRFDVLVAMDRGHLREMRARCPKALQSKLVLMPDYEQIYRILDGCSRGLLDALESETRETTTETTSVPRA